MTGAGGLCGELPPFTDWLTIHLFSYEFLPELGPVGDLSQCTIRAYLDPLIRPAGMLVWREGTGDAVCDHSIDPGVEAL
jgi:hypothetical protein